MPKKKPEPVIIPGAVPIIGQQPVRYNIGGVELGFVVPPDEVRGLFEREMGGNSPMSPSFVMHWQRTAIHFVKHDERLKVAESKVAELTVAVDQLRKLISGAQGERMTN